MEKIHKFINLISYTFRSFHDTRGINKSHEEKSVIVQIKSPLRFRHFYRLVHNFNISGYNVLVYLPSLYSIYQFAKMGGGLDLLPPVKLITRLPKWAPLAAYCSDFQDQIWNRNWRKKIYVEFDWQKTHQELINPIYIPFSVHDFVHRSFWKEREVLLNNKKNIRIFFSGAYMGYRDGGISKILGKMERQEIIEIFREHPNTIIINSQTQLDEILNSPPSKNYYLIDQNKFRIPPSEWLKVLSHVEVFLCPPGVVNVMCHNAHEAIAMGAIPLINYPEWFFPILEDRKNSYVYSNRDELIKYLNQICEFSEMELSEKRNNVLHYFDQYQSDNYIIKKMRELTEYKIITFVMNVNKKLL